MCVCSIFVKVRRQLKGALPPVGLGIKLRWPIWPQASLPLAYLTRLVILNPVSCSLLDEDNDGCNGHLIQILEGLEHTVYKPPFYSGGLKWFFG